jgi:hypothetical protein
MSTTCVITARDFIDNRVNGKAEWTAGMLRHVIAALAGSPVVITTDAQTGHSLVNAKLVGIRSGWDYPVLTIEVPMSDGEIYTTTPLIFKLGETITPLDPPASAGLGAKWAALNTYRNEKSAALEYVKTLRPEAAEWWGSWKMKPGLYNVAVTYTPSKGNPAFADRWHTNEFFNVPLSALAVKV